MHITPQPTTPVVVVPPDTQLATEPAKTIGDIFANKALVKTYVAAIAGIIATILRVTVDDAMVDNITTVVQLVAVFATPILAQLEHRQVAKAQADATRQAVYAPSTVRQLAREAASAGTVEVIPGSPRNAP